MAEFQHVPTINVAADPFTPNTPGTILGESVQNDRRCFLRGDGEGLNPSGPHVFSLVGRNRSSRVPHKLSRSHSWVPISRKAGVLHTSRKSRHAQLVFFSGRPGPSSRRTQVSEMEARCCMVRHWAFSVQKRRSDGRRDTFKSTLRARVAARAKRVEEGHLQASVPLSQATRVASATTPIKRRPGSMVFSSPPTIYSGNILGHRPEALPTQLDMGFDTS